jgi:methylmalonyl-CoA mutase N-terminal domain/subunit
MMRGMPDTSEDQRPVVARPEDAPLDYARDLGDPGAPPYTRGIYPTMYRGRRWTMRQYAGSARRSEQRALARCSPPARPGCGRLRSSDPDGLRLRPRPRRRRVGRVGVAISTLADMEALVSDLPWIASRLQ